MSSGWKIPSSWEWIEMGDVADIVGGGTPSTTESSNFDGDIPWITPADLSGYRGKYIRSGARNISQRGYEGSGARMLPAGTVLFSSRAPIGYVAIAEAEVATNQGFKSFIPRAGLDPEFLFYWLTSAKRLAEELASGTTFLELSGAKAALLPMPLPPSSEQGRIVAKLEELLSDLDAGATELKAAQKKLKRYRQSLLKAAVEGSLTANWRAAQRGQGAPAETGAQLLECILAERRTRWEARQLARFKEQGRAPPKDWQKKYPEPVRPGTAGLPELPEGWVWARIGECFQVAVGATPSRQESRYWSGEIPWISSGEVRFNRIRSTKETITEAGLANSSTQINPSGSVLLGMIGEGKTRGQVAILDISAANNQNCAAIWVSETPIPSEFLYFWLRSQYEQTRRMSSGNNQPAMNKSIVEAIAFPLPPLDEIYEVVRMVEQAEGAVARQESAVALSLAQSAAQRQNILRAAFAGQLVPQDPNDEPASALLERIRTERAAQAPARKPPARKKQAANRQATA